MHLITLIETPKPDHYDITPVEYAASGSLILGLLLIIGWFFKNMVRGLTSSNKELKEAIEKLANVASIIHTDLLTFKAEVADNYATKSTLQDLRVEISKSCALRHRRRNDEDVF